LSDISNAADSSSSNYTIEDPVIDSGMQSSSSLNFGLGQSLSQIAIGQSSSASFQLWSGFQYFFKVDPNVLTATATLNDGEVDLSWTVPQTFLGATVAGYEVGTGTTSGSYTFEDVGNVTSFTKSGLLGGTTYYFIIKTYAPGGTFLVFSNEDSATTSGIPPVPPPPPPGGSGGGIFTRGQITISGTAYPNSQVTILRDSQIYSLVAADPAGHFSVTLTDQSPGTYTYGVYATDINGVRSPILGFERTITGGTTTTADNLVIAPSIGQSHTVVKQGEAIVFSGYTAPNAAVTLRFTGQQSFNIPVISDAAGYYTYSLDTGARAKGNYAVSATVVVNGVTSPPSFVLNFTIGDNMVVPPTGTCGRSDLNCDGRVNLVDFSILLYYWESDFSRNPRADIDNNGAVGLRDLSIMLYDWTG
jgi:hypothetical protein